MFKKGDKVKLVTERFYDDNMYNPVWNGNMGQVAGVVSEIGYDNITVFWDNGVRNTYINSDLELINNDSLAEDVTISSKESTKTMINLKENFLLAVTPEPMKSFRKAGITNGDNLLTDEGQKIFLTWLLGKNQEEFKKEIVDSILEEDK